MTLAVLGIDDDDDDDDFAHTIKENIKMAHTTAYLNAESFWW